MPADIVFDPAFNQAAQAAALIMAQVRNASHNPARDFGTGGCWTEAGQLGAANGNLAVGIFGVDAVDGYINDKVILNVGHRTVVHPRFHPRRNPAGRRPEMAAADPPDPRRPHLPLLLPVPPPAQ
jgi:hypothetical protein